MKNQFKETYTSTLKEVEVYLDLIIYRPLAFPIILIARKLKLSPNFITTISFVLSIFSAYFFAAGQNIYASVFLFLATLFDCMDGQLARLTGQFSKKGARYDQFVDITGTITIFAGIIYNQYSGDNTIFILAAMSLLLTSIDITFFDNLRERFLSQFHPEKEKPISVEMPSRYNRIIKKLSPLPVLPLNISPIEKEKYKKKFLRSVYIWSFIAGTAHRNTLIILAFIDKLELTWIICILYFSIALASLIIYQNIIHAISIKRWK